MIKKDMLQIAQILHHPSEKMFSGDPYFTVRTWRTLPSNGENPVWCAHPVGEVSEFTLKVANL